MKLHKHLNLLSSLLLLLLLTLSTSCSLWKSDEAEDTFDNDAPPQMTTSMKDSSEAPLPVQYQKPSYMVDMQAQQDLDLESDDVVLKVGAKIQSTSGPQPLVAILKQLASLKSMNVSWASDVDQNVLVDVDISANDDFFQAIDNLLRQVDYFHEIQDNTVVVKYRETKQYHVAMPFTKQTYETGTGGNVLGSEETAANIEGTIRLDSKGNEFNIWETIENNLKTILEAWATESVSNAASATPGEAVAAAAAGEEPSGSAQAANVTRQRSGSNNVYLIDKPVGIITVTGPRPLHEKVQQYFDNLTKSIYRQISIEAKIIEVQLTDNSSIGINWSQVLKNFNLSGSVEFGSGGQIWPFIFSNNKKWNDGTNHGKSYDPGNFISKVSLNTANFNVFLNALKEQGDTKILSNPKIAVLNGQPALITVGRNVTYIDSIDSELDSDTGLITYTANTERILSGVGLALTATILGDDEIVMNLVPVTSELEEPIEYEDIGTLGGKIGLPVINVREISSTVKVKDGEMLVLGGLITKNKDTQGEFFPLLGSIPLVRYLFGYEEKVKEKRELIILLRPRII